MGMTPTLIFVIPPAVSPPPAGADSPPPPDGLPPPHAVNASTAASATAALILFTDSLFLTPECTDVPQLTHSIYVHSVQRQRSIRIVINGAPRPGRGLCGLGEAAGVRLAAGKAP